MPAPTDKQSQQTNERRLTTAEASYGLMPEDVWLILDDANKGNCQRQSKLCEEIQEKDWDIGQALQTRAAVMAATEWNIIPARGDNSAEAKSIAADVKEDLRTFSRGQRSGGAHCVGASTVFGRGS